MKTYPLDALASGFADLIAEARPGEEIVLTDHEHPVAKVVPFSRLADNHGRSMKAGCLPGFRMSTDFDAPLEEFKDYSP